MRGKLDALINACILFNSFRVTVDAVIKSCSSFVFWDLTFSVTQLFHHALLLLGKPRGVILMRLEHAGKIQSASLISAAAAEVAED